MPTNPYYLSAHWRQLRLACLTRDRWTCRGCRRRRATTVDHVVTRERVPYPTPLDRLDNLRSLCGDCDRRVKETRWGKRRNDGDLTVRGCDVDGMPFDPAHRR